MTPEDYKAARNALGLKQDQLAEILGVTRKTITSRENGAKVTKEAELAIKSLAPQSCQWTEDGDGNWDTACGERFVFETGGPTENRAKWCHYCGRGIETVGYFEENTES